MKCLNIFKAFHLFLFGILWILYNKLKSNLGYYHLIVFLIPPCYVQRQAHSFQPQMKLEAVDKRSPGLIRVATVEEVDTHRIKVLSVPPSFLFLVTNGNGLTPAVAG